MKKMFGIIFTVMGGFFSILVVSGVGDVAESLPKEILTEIGTIIGFIFMFLLGFYLLISDKQDKILEEMKKLQKPEKSLEEQLKEINLTLYSFQVRGGGVLFVIATNREEAIEIAESQHGVDKVSYLSEDPIDKIPFTVYR